MFIKLYSGKRNQIEWVANVPFFDFKKQNMTDRLILAIKNNRLLVGGRL